MAIPTIGATNCRGYVVLPTVSGGQIECLASLYGQPPVGAFFNENLFYVAPGETLPPPGTLILFDVVANPNYNPNLPTSPTALAANIRVA
jgi:hypothetical protein